MFNSGPCWLIAVPAKILLNCFIADCWECREYVALSDVSLSVCNVVDYRFIGQWYRIKKRVVGSHVWKCGV